MWFNIRSGTSETLAPVRGDACARVGNNKDWQLWQQHNQPIELITIDMFHQKLQYIHDNPVGAGFVEHEEEYWYSSARDFHGKKGLIELSYVV